MGIEPVRVKSCAEELAEWIAQSAKDHATIAALRKRVEELEGALEQLEAANEQLAATRSSETYCMMLTDDGAEDALEALDGARSRARAALRAKGGEHGDA